MALTSSNKPRPADYLDRGARVPDELQDSVQAKPLYTPEFANLRPKLTDRVIDFRWVNRAVPTKEGLSTLRLDQMIAAGFVHAKPEDVEGGCPPSLIKDGHIVYGDCVLLKIDKGRMDAAKKFNWERAIQRGSREFDYASGRQAVSQEVNSHPQAAKRPDLVSKLSTFQPTDQQLANIGSGGNIADATKPPDAGKSPLPIPPVKH